VSDARRTPDVYLASRSPRRRQLLDQLGLNHGLIAVDVDERWDGNESPARYVLRLARQKACTGWAAIAGERPHPVLAADTAVVIGGEILGKPRTRDEGLRMLARLSGRTHEIYTGVALVWAEGMSARLNVSRVRFRSITRSEMDDYWASGEPADKAGAYAIQGRGAVFVDHLEGSYSGVVGLPLYETAQMLDIAGVRGWRAPPPAR